MAASVIGALRVNLGMNSAEFTDGVKQANKSMDRFGRNMANIAKTVATVFAGIASGAAVAFGATSKAIADLYAEAQTAGVSFESFQKLKIIAEQSQVSIDALTDGMKELNLRADEFIATGGGSAKEAFERLGFSSEELAVKLKKPEELLADIIGRLEGMETAAQIRIADEIFGGTGGEQFVRLISQGADGIRDMASALDDYGIIVSDKAGRAAQEFQRTLSWMKTLFVGMANQLTVRMLPTLQYLADQFIYNKNVVTALQGGVEILAGAFNGMVRVIMLVINNLDTLYKLFKIFVAAKIVTYLAAAAGAFLTLARAIKATGLVIGAFTAIQRVGIKGLVMIAGAIAIATGKYEQLENAIGSLWDRVKTLIPEDLVTDAAGFFKNIDISTKSAANSLETFFRAVDRARDSFQSTSGAGSNLARSVGEVGEKSKDAWAGLRKVSNTAKETIQPIANTFQNAFGSWVDQAIDGTFKFRDAIADLGKQLLKTFANRAIQNLFGAILGGVGGTSLAVGGMTLPGFANGGSFTVGGSGGVDSQLVAFRASPNEQVTVTKPGQMPSGGAKSGGGGGTVVNVINNSNAGVSQKRRSGPDGQEIIDVMIGKSLAGGRQDKPMSRFGAKPQALGVG